MALADEHIEFIIGRKNQYTGNDYKNDPTIMAWQLANEPRALTNQKAYYSWVKNTSTLIKRLDPNHLVSIGSEGNAFVPFSRKFKKENNFESIDYATIHIWIQNWRWYDPEKPEKTFDKALRKAERYIRKHVRKAKKLSKPLVLEEFGIARDNGSYDPNSSTYWRDKYYTEVFSLIGELMEKGEPILGANCWAWAGEGRPREPKSIWKIGDDFTGDPPFEYQGWYSIYNSDSKTLELIKQISWE